MLTKLWSKSVRFVFALPVIAAVLSAGTVGWLTGCQGSDSTTPFPLPSATACGPSAADCVPLAGASPVELAIGNLNAGGAPDIAVANMDADNISVLLNNGGGTVVHAADYAVGNSPSVVKMADLNRDGTQDLICTAGVFLFTFLNNGDATFRQGTTVALPNVSFTMTVADFNGDGSPDVATANGLSGVITILLNDGGDKFTTAPTVSTPAEFTQLGFITAAEVDTDLRIDLIVVETFGGNVFVLKGNGDGTFAAPLSVNVGANHVLYSATPVDLDGDGHLDLVVADGGNPLDIADPGSVDVLHNDGTGVFTLTMRLAAGRTPVSIAAADFNQDGFVDLAVANSDSNDVSILFQSGLGDFLAPRNVAVGEGPSFIATADLNGDGVSDLAVTNLRSNTVTILLNDGVGNFAP